MAARNSLKDYFRATASTSRLSLDKAMSGMARQGQDRPFVAAAFQHLGLYLMATMSNDESSMGKQLALKAVSQNGGLPFALAEWIVM